MKIALAQLNLTVGDIDGNLNKIIRTYHKVKYENDLLVCSELALTGYYPQDLLLRESLLLKQWQALQKLKIETKGYSCGIVIGYAAENNSKFGQPLFNALAVLKDGEQLFEYHKQLLPTYNVFDEARHFAEGHNENWLHIDGKMIGFLICEDAWYEENRDIYRTDPVFDLEGKELDCVISINASPSNLGKQDERLKLASRIVERTHAPFVYVNQVGANDELVFDGSSFIINSKSRLIAQAKSFEEDLISLELNDNAAEVFSKTKKEEFLWKQVVLGIRDYVTKCGLKKVVVGSSGGIDSAVTLAICAEALGGENVVAITMPSKYSSEGSVIDSVTLCENLGVKLLNASIAEEFEIAVKQFELMSGEEPSGLTQENIQARIRGRILMEYSNHFGALVISTGNKSELSVGYATLYGDMNGGINPLGDLYKMEVYALAKYFNEKEGKELIPNIIIEKAPSAELSEDQVDSDSLPEYPLLDAILKLYIEEDLLDDSQAKKCHAVIERFGASEKDIERIHRMVDSAEFKRRQAPPIIRVQKRSFGMGRWLPVAAKY
jgi:NAD+ synthase (glutamine-hydrolysing)